MRLISVCVSGWLMNSWIDILDNPCAKLEQQSGASPLVLGVAGGFHLVEVPLLLIRDGLSEHKEDKASGDRQVVRQQRKRRPLCCLCRWEDDNEEEDVLIDRDEANMKCRPCDRVLDDLAQHLCNTRRLARRCMMGHDTVRRQSPKKKCRAEFPCALGCF